MSDEQEEDLILDDTDNAMNDVITVQLEVLLYINDMELDTLYDDWKLHKTAAISRAMKIITKAQNIILKELK